VAIARLHRRGFHAAVFGIEERRLIRPRRQHDPNIDAVQRAYNAG